MNAAIVLLQTIGVGLVLLGLFRARRVVGLAPLYVCVGVLQVLQAFLAALFVEVLPGLQISIGSTVLFPATLGAILAVYIRDVDPDSDSPFDSKVDGIIEDSTATGVPFLRVADSSLIAEHAAELGLLTRAQVERVALETHREEDLDSLPREVLEEVAPSLQE